MEDFKLSEDDNFFICLILEEKHGAISGADAKLLAEWRSLKKENNLLYNSILEVEDELTLLETYRNLNVEGSLIELHRKLDAPQASKKRKNIILMTWLAAAACLAFILFGVYYLNYRNDLITLETTEMQSRQFLLPDGSKVILNGKSLLTFSKKNFKSNRKLTFVSGECFFEVVHNDRNPFSVSYKDLTVKDVGTAFNMNLEKGQVNVIVDNGKVEMNSRNTSKVTYLRAGESAAYLVDKRIIGKSELDDVNYKAYVDHVFHFNNSALSDVVATLHKSFHQKIVLVGVNLRGKRLTADFKNQTLKDILNILETSLNVKVTLKQGIVYIAE